MRFFFTLLQIFLIVLGKSLSSRRITVMTNLRMNKLPGVPRASDDKIVGGWYVNDITKMPYMVSISMYNDSICGGGLLTLDFVITACHCVAEIPENGPGVGKIYDFGLDVYDIIAGTTNLVKYESGAQIGKIKSIHIHPQCQNMTSIVYDLSLLKMCKPFVATLYVQVLKMYTWDKDRFKRIFLGLLYSKHKPKCIVAGWGETRRGEYDVNIASPQLKYLSVYAIRAKDCQIAWTTLKPTLFTGFKFWDYGQICVISENRISSNCVGDSGSPYTCSGHLIGVVSFGTESCASGNPSVFQTVSVMMDWVKKDFSGQIGTEEPKSVSDDYNSDDDDDEGEKEDIWDKTEYDDNEDYDDDEEDDGEDRRDDNNHYDDGRKPSKFHKKKPHSGRQAPKSSQQHIPHNALLVLSSPLLSSILEEKLRK